MPGVHSNREDLEDDVSRVFYRGSVSCERLNLVSRLPSHHILFLGDGDLWDTMRAVTITVFGQAGFYATFHSFISPSKYLQAWLHV